MFLKVNCHWTLNVFKNFVDYFMVGGGLIFSSLWFRVGIGDSKLRLLQNRVLKLDIAVFKYQVTGLHHFYDNDKKSAPRFQHCNDKLTLNYNINSHYREFYFRHQICNKKSFLNVQTKLPCTSTIQVQCQQKYSPYNQKVFKFLPYTPIIMPLKVIYFFSY